MKANSQVVSTAAAHVPTATIFDDLNDKESGMREKGDKRGQNYCVEYRSWRPPSKKKKETHGLEASGTVSGAPPNSSAIEAAVDHVSDRPRPIVLFARLALVPYGVMSKAGLLGAPDADDHGLLIALGVKLARVAMRVLAPDEQSTVGVRSGVFTHEFS